MTKPISFSNFNKETNEGGKPGLWANIHKRRKAGKAPKKPGDKGYPKTLDIEAKEAFSASAIAKKPRTGDGKPLGGKLPSWMTTKAPDNPKEVDKDKSKKMLKGTNVTYDTNGRVVKEYLSAADKKLMNKMYDKKGNQTAIGKKVMDHGAKKAGKKNIVQKPRTEAAILEIDQQKLAHKKKLMLIKLNQKPGDLRTPAQIYSAQNKRKYPKGNLQTRYAAAMAKKAGKTNEAVATMMVTRPGSNAPIKITADQWPSFKARGYHHAEQKENLNLINKIKKSGVVRTGSMSKDDGEAERKRAADFQAGLDKAKANLKARQAARKANTDEAVKEMKMQCKDCGCEYGNINPECDCPNDGSDKEGTHFVSMDEALDMKQRLARGRAARKNKAKLAMGRKRAGRRIASMKVLKKRAQRAARKTMTKRLTKGVAKTDLSPARKREIEKRLDKPAFKTKIDRLVKRTIKDIRKKEIARKRK